MLSFVRCTMALLCFTGPSLFAQPAVQADRVAAYPEFSGGVRLAGHVPRWIADAADQGSVPAATPLTVTFVLSRSPERQAAFTQLLADQQDTASASYHQWLTPQQVGQRFGPTQHDLDTLTSWLAARGLTSPEISPSGTFVAVHASAAAVSAALSTSIHAFATAGGTRLAATQDPALPATLAGIIQSVEGLSETLEQPSVHELAPSSQASAQPRSVSPRYTYLSTYHYVTPDDFATMFDLKPSYTAGFLGTGQRIAVIGRSRVVNSDITQFESIIERGTNLPNVVLPNPNYDPGYTADGDQAEATLDVSRVVGTAPLAQVDLVIVSSAGGGIGAAAQYAVNTLNDPILNISFGSCENNRGASGVSYWDTLFAQAAAQGISVFVSSGDSGAAGCDLSGLAAPSSQVASINYICSSPYATCVGGTQLTDLAASNYWSSYNDSLNGSALGYIPEGAWNEPAGTSAGIPYPVLATGGGASAYIAKPAWQNGSGVPADGRRDVPDMSFPAASHNAYYTCYATDGGDCSQNRFALFYGTSAGTPSMAAITALINQRTGTRQGNLNPLLYQLAANSANNVFHDASVPTSGVYNCSAATPSTCNNSTPGSTSLTGGLAGYVLTPGFDLATGWGSLDVGNLLAAVGSAQAATTTTVALSPASGFVLVGTNVVFNATVSSNTAGSPGGFVQFYLNGSPYGSAAAVNAGTASLTTSFNSDTTGSVTAYYSGDANFAPSTAAFWASLNVHRLYSVLSVSPTSAVISVLAQQGYTVTLNGTGPTPTGTVQLEQQPFTSTQINLGTFPIINGRVTIPPMTFTPGSSTLIFNYSGDSSYEASSITSSLTVNGLSAAVTLSTAATSISPPQTASFSASIAAPSGTPTGTLQLYIDSLAVTTPITLSGSTPVQFAAQTVALGTHSVYATYSGDALYGTLRSNLITLTNSGFRINPASYGYNFAAGATNTITVTYQSVAGFSGTIAQSCTITIPTNSSQRNYAPLCSFSPATVTLAANGTATSTLTITSAATPQAVTTHQFTRNTPSRPTRSPALPTAAMAGVFLICLRPKRLPGSLLRIVIFGAVALLAANGLIACSSGTTTGSSDAAATPYTGPSFYAFVITGTSGSVVETSGAINTQIQ